MTTQFNAQFNISPFQRIEIDIGASSQFPLGIDRRQGEYFPQIEGDGYFIERSDFPVLISHVHSATQVESTIPAYDGRQVEGKFKGLYFTHPPLNIPARLSLIIGKNCAKTSNQLGNAVSRFVMAYRSVVSNPNAQVLGIYIPPGARVLRNLNIFIAGQLTATSTGGIAAVDKNFATIRPPSNLVNQQSTGFVTYDRQSNFGQNQIGVAVPGGGFVYNYNPIIIPSQALELNFTVLGTGMTDTGVNNINTVNGNWE